MDSGQRVYISGRVYEAAEPVDLEDTWNGWLQPAFDLETAIRIVDDNNEGESIIDPPISFATDVEQREDGLYVFKGWCWELASDYEGETDDN